MKRTTLTLALAATLALSACGSIEGQATDSPTSGSNAPTETVSETSEQSEVEPAEAEPESSLTGADPGILKMGESFTYSDGLQVTISKPTAMTSSEWAVPGSTAGLSFDIKIVNGTDATYDPSLDYFTAQIGNTEAEQIFDSENGYDGTPMTTVLPGRETTYKVGFVGTDSTNLVLEYQPGDFERGSLVYTPNGK